MTTTVKDYIFTGKANWIKSTPSVFDDGTSAYTMSFYPDNADTRKAVQATGTKAKPRLDDETGEAFFSFRNKEAPYKIIDEQGQDITALVGNGSEVKIKLNVEAFTSPKYGASARTKLLEVMVTKLVAYEKPVVEDTDASAKARTETQAELPV